jgi:predicted SprT family Zn-dependent metalloprotease
VLFDVADHETLDLLRHYLSRLQLPSEHLRVTTDRQTFERWLGRRVGSSLGGAYAFLPRLGEHAILINLPRIDRSRPKALEIVVAEELIHMRDHLDGDRRRHAKHGHDRIAHRVAALTGTTLDDVRSCLLPVRRRPVRYLYVCPGCGRRVARRVRGTWSCGTCSPVFDRRYVLRLEAWVEADAADSDNLTHLDLGLADN